MSSWVDDLRTGRRTPPPAARMLGFELLEHDPQAMSIRVAFTAREEFCNAVGHVQGGMLGAMLDSTLGSVVVATLDEGEWSPTTDLHVQFHSPGRVGRLVGTGRVTRRGAGIAFASGELADESGTVVASAVATSAVRRAR